jgi:hypothetical protein
MALAYNGMSETQTNFPHPVFSARYLTNTSVRMERTYAGVAFPAWVEGIDFSGIHYIDNNPTVFSLSADDGILQIKEGVQNAVNLTTDEVKVTNLQFTNLSSGDRENIRIQMTIEYNGSVDDPRYKFTRSWEEAVSVRQ